MSQPFRGSMPDMLDCTHWIGGKRRSGAGDEVLLSSPWTGQAYSKHRAATPAEISEAVVLAAAAQKDWGLAPHKERARVLFAFREELMRRKDEISKVISLESGKTLGEAEAGLMKGVEVLEYALSLQNLDVGGRMEVSRGVFCEYRRVPLGVVAGIMPFNFPAMVPMWMLPIALALGNSFIWKASEKVPATSLMIAEALAKAGLPAGVLTVLHGGKSVVEALLDHPEIKAVGFVGSTPVAREVYKRGTGNLKRVLALGGAKNPIVLLPDADPDVAAQGIADSFTGCAGQRCMAASVLLAVGDCEKLMDSVVERASKAVPASTMGAIITSRQVSFLKDAIGRAVADGARVRLDGRAFKAPSPFEGGNWLGPTILDHVKPGSEAATRELFGPILSIVRCKDFTQAMDIARANPYGNATSVFTRSGGLAEDVARQSTAGMIGVNIGVPVPREPFSFGGTRDSKFGQGEITGEGALALWSDLKKVTVKWAPVRGADWMS